MAELAVTDPYWPPLSDLPQGECIMTTLYDETGAITGVRIDQADPRILISAELLNRIVTGAMDRVPLARLDMTDCLTPGTMRTGPLPCQASYVGAVLKIGGVNRTVIYRITEFIPRVYGYIGEWPH